MTEEEDPWFGIGPRDACVLVGTTRFYVKVVRRGGQLLEDQGSDGRLVSALVAAGTRWLDTRVARGGLARTTSRAARSRPGRTVARASARAQHLRGWKIGVIRQGGDRWGPTGPTEVVHVETLPPGPFPEARVTELAEAASTGRFAEAGRRWGRNTTSD